MDVSIIIVNYNTEKHLRRCLKSFFNFIYKIDIEVIVVDNNSNSKEIFNFPKLFSKVKFIFKNKNLGFGAASNLGFKNSSGKYIAFVNPDIEFISNCFDTIFEYMESHDNLGFCSGLLTDKCDNLIYSYNNFPYIYWEFLEAKGRDTDYRINKLLSRSEIQYSNQPFEVDWFNGAFIVTSSEVLREIGGFDDKNFFLYYEDVDIHLRAKNIGKINICIPSVRVRHYERSSVRSFEGENFYYLHMHRSKMLYYYKNATFFARNLIRLMHLLGFSFRAFVLPFRRKFKKKKFQKFYQYVMLIKIYFSFKSQILKMHDIPQNFILKYINKKGLNKFVKDEFWEKV